MKQLNILLSGKFQPELVDEIEELGHLVGLNQQLTQKFDCVIFSSFAEFISHANDLIDGFRVFINNNSIILAKDSKTGYLLFEGATDSVPAIDDIVNVVMALSRDEFEIGRFVTFPVSDAISATTNEYKQQLERWNNTRVDYPEYKLLHQLFEEQTQKTPENIALVCGTVQLSYRQLNNKANQLATYLKNTYQLKGDDLVALCLSRNEYMLIAILGVLKAGAAYVPLDPGYPQDRIQYILEDTKASVLLTNTEATAVIQSTNILAIDSPELQATLAKQPAENPNKIITSHNLAYIIYTSGTTGKPKGVMLEHSGVVNLAIMQGQLFGLKPVDNPGLNCLVYANYVFDAFVSEVFTALSSGHCAHLISNDLRQDFNALAQYIAENNIYIATIPPAFLIPDSLLKLKCMVVAGEQSPQNILDQYLAAGIRVINAYGPTETTVCSSLHDYSSSDVNTANIGRPLNNTTAYILDEQMQMVAPATLGELYIGGVGLARGYLNRSDLSSERFIANPFQSEADKSAGINSRIYKTGDMAKFLADGSIEYAGRNDFQVKIRGFRIEPGEIETKLAGYPGVKQAVVLAHENKSDGNGKFLVAFYTADNTIAHSHLREYLSAILPDYMIPAIFMPIGSLPMTINGKLDRNDLLSRIDSTAKNLVHDYSSYGEVAAFLAQLWQELINCRKVELSDSFFGLGGHSLLVTKLILRIKKQYMVILTPHQIYAAATLSGLADLIKSVNRLPSPNYEPRLYSVAEKEYLLNPYQLSIYFAHLANNTAYTVPVFIKVKKPLDIPKAVAAFISLIQKYQVLSGAISESEAGLVHHFAAHQPLVEYKTAADIDSHLQQISAQAFDLAVALSDFRLIQVEDSNSPYSVLSFTHHHIIADGYSIDLMLKEFFAFYTSSNTSEDSYAYADVVKLIMAEDKQTNSLLPSYPVNQHFTLTGDKKNTSNSSAAYILEFNQQTKGAVRKLARKYSTSVNSIMLSSIYLTLYRYTGEADINMGIVFANRENPFTENVIGCLVNTLPLEINFADKSATVSGFIPEIANSLNDYSKCSSYPLQDLLNSMSDKSDSLFRLVYASQYINDDAEIGKSMEKLMLSNGNAKFDLAFNLYHSVNPERMEIEYNAGKYSESFIAELSGTIQIVLGQMDANPRLALIDIQLLEKAGYDQQVYSWNQTSADYPSHKTIVDIFQEQVLRTPNNIALVYENVILSYSELNSKTNQLANYLRSEFNITSGDLIALCLERSEYILIAILGVLKAGAAYIPLDPEYPDERIKYILQDTKANILLTNSEHKDRISRILDGSQQTVILTIDSKELKQQLTQYSNQNLQLNINSCNLAYVIYTSGTTGKPKGVMIEHRGVVNLVEVEAKDFDLPQLNSDSLQLQKNCLQYANYVFDAHVWEIFCVISTGHQLHILSADKRHDIDLLAYYIEHNLIHVATIPPALLTRDKILRLNKLVVAGDKTDSMIIREYLTKNIDVINAYGPTETTVCATLKHYTENSPANDIGRPLANFTLYVLDNNLQLLPIGAIGELYIGGDGLSRGYLNRPDLTAERFIPSPFHPAQTPSYRLYKTGDLVRYLPHGEIEYIGRNDFQVKIRGFRIELGEIETALTHYTNATAVYPIQQSVALVIDGQNPDGNKYLVAYYVAAAPLDEISLLKYLSSVLPDYMIPNYLIHIDKMPMTINGKLDTKALPLPETCSGNYVAPRDSLEQQVCQIYAKVLGRDVTTISIVDDFFRLGGSSIQAIHLVSQLNKLLFSSRITVAAIFKFRTIANLMDNINNAAETNQVIIPRLIDIETEQNNVLSFAQERLWFIEHYEGGTRAYNTPLVYEINHLTDIAILKQALIATVNRHEVLHSLIKSNANGDGHQVIIDLTNKPLEIERITLESNEELRQQLDDTVNYVFDLTKEYPIRISVYSLEDVNDNGQNILDGTGQIHQSAPHKNYLVMVIHHIAFDGWSMDVLLRDLHGYYRYFEQQAVNETAILNLPQMTIQYRDFAAWQRGFLTGDFLDKQLSYWRNQLSDYVGLDLPTDYPRPGHLSYAGDDVLFSIDEETSIKLRAIGQELGVSLYCVMLSGFYIFLRAYSNQSDIVVGSPVANRNYPQLEELVGFFVNSLALRTKINPEMSLDQYIREIGSDIIEAQLYQDLPFEKLVSDLQISKDQSRHPMFQVMFGVQSFGSTSNSKTKPVMSLFSQFDKYSHREFGLYDGYKVAKLDLTVMINDGQNQLFGSFNYATSLYSRTTIERFIETYITILRQLPEKLSQPIKMISYLSDRAYTQIMQGWNDTYAEFARDKTLHQLLEEQVLRTPDNVAVVSGEVSLSYREFNSRANQLAHYLSAKHGVIADDMVVLCLDRSEYMLLAVQGTLKAGAAYVPMDSGYPDERISYILKDTKTKVVLTNEKYLDRLKSIMNSVEFVGIQPTTSADSVIPAKAGVQPPAILAIDSPELQRIVAEQSTENPNTVMSSRNLAYVIYTSGTTGNPKGVMLEHRGVVNRIKWMNDTYPLNEQDRILQKTPYVFDVSVWELFWAHWYGASIVFAKPEGHKDSNYLIELINEQGITVMHFVPSMLSVFEDTLEVEVEQKRVARENPLPSLRYIFCSGEALNLTQAQKCHKLMPFTELHNLYGPTEASVDVLYYDCSPKDLAAVYIGKPVYNTTAYVVDNNLNPLPIGAVGELLIGGVQLARGYLNLAEMTAAKFIVNPFRSGEEKYPGEHERLYKTGDLVRLLGDGNIEYIGRNDFQIKIRGFRVELGEVETALNGFAEVKSAVVLALEHKDVNGKPNGNKYLAGYYVADKRLDENAMLSSLSGQLPEYMVPSALVHLSILPVTINGKLDRRSLPEPVFKQSEGYVAPRNEIERQVCAIYSELLGMDETHISIYDDFFRLGGDSIVAIMLVSRIRQRINLVVSVKDIFSYKTIAKLYEKVLQIKEGAGTKKLIAESGILSGEFGLLPIQEWFFAQVKSGIFRKPDHWNQSLLLRVPKLEIQILAYCLQKLLEYHDSLRLGYRLDKNGEYHQFYRLIDEINEIKIHYLNRSTLSDEKLEAIFTSWQSGFDLQGKDVLFSVGYIDGYTDGSSRLYFAFHHLLVGAVSWRIIAHDLKNLYAKFLAAKSHPEELINSDAEEILGTKGASYRQWIQVIASYETLYPNERSYWHEHIYGMARSNTNLNNLLKKMEYKLDVNLAMASANFSLDKTVTKLLLTTSGTAFNTEINHLLLSALGLTLAEFIGEDVNYITLEGHGREELGNIDMSHTVGWCTSLYPVCLNVDSYDIGKTIVNIKEQLRGIPNKGVGYGALYGYTEHELPQVSFNYLGQFDVSETVINWKVVRESSGIPMHRDNIDRNLFNINCMVSHGEFQFHIFSRLNEQQLSVFTQTVKKKLNEIISYTAQLGRSYLSVCDINFIIRQEYLDRLQAEKDVEAVYLANSLQQGFIYHVLSNENADTAYRVQLIFDYSNPLQPDLFQIAWQGAVNRFGALRLRFAWDEEIVQIIDKAQELYWNYQDLSLETEANNLIEETVRQDRVLAYDLSKGQLLRIYLFKLDENSYTCLMSNHHAILDGWSTPCLLAYVHDLYLKLLEIDKDKLSDFNKSIVAHEIYKSAQYYIQSHAQESEIYWAEQIKKVGEFADLSYLLHDNAKNIVLSEYRAIKQRKEEIIIFDTEIMHKLHHMTQSYGLTINAVLQYIWHRILYVYGNVATTVVGTTVSGRNIPIAGIEEAIGLYINTLPLIVNHNAKTTILNAIQVVQEDVNNINTHSGYNLSKLQTKGLFDSLFVYENYPSPEHNNSSQIQCTFRKAIEELDYPLGLIAFEKDGLINLILKYAGEIFNPDKIRKLLSVFELLLNDIVSGYDISNRKVAELSYLDKDSYEQIMQGWNDTYAEFARDKTLHQLLEEQVLRTPDNVAVVSGEVSLSYREFNSRANQLAHYLSAKHGVIADDMVVLCLDRSEYMLLAVQGTLKAGAAYVPMDSGYPDERISYILKDTKTKVVLTNEKYLDRLKSIMNSVEFVGIQPTTSADSVIPAKAGVQPPAILAIDSPELQRIVAEQSTENPNTVMSSRNLAYVIYTSGTTGNPKGVMLEHRGVVNRIKWMNDTYPLNEQDRILQKTPYVFDVSVWELFWAHWYGASIVFAKPEGHKDSNYLIELINEQGITVMHFVPSMLSVFEDTLEVEVEQKRVARENPLPSLRYIFCSGEALNLTQAQKCHKLMPFTELHNLYGPTEASVDVLYYDCSPKDLAAVYIGKPVYNTTAYVVDNNLNPLPIGAVGELLIGGVQLARGYLNLAEMTAAKFIVNPFRSGEEKYPGEHERLYKTGDLVRLLGDGNIEYIGRNDFQIKIRGFRVELGEVETALNGFAEVKSAVVLALEHKDVNGKPNGNKYLAGYYVADKRLDENAMLSSLSGQLPEYMVPSALVHLSILPVTINGKLDRRSLPEPVFKQSEGYVAPRNEIERQVCAIYSEVLGITRVGIDDDFYRLGGNSILAIKVVSKLNLKIFTQSKISVSSIFKYKTIRALLDKINIATDTIIIPQLKPLEKNNRCVLSFAQERLWFLEKYEGGSNAYNTLMVYDLNDEVDFDVLEKSLYQTVQRHEVLYSLIKTDAAGHGYQQIDDMSKFEVQQYVVSSIAELKTRIGIDANHIYDLAGEYPFRIGFYILSGQTHQREPEKYLSISVHHIAFDGWSMDIFLRDLHEYYRYNMELAKGEYSVSIQLPELSIQYRDFAVWQRKYLSGDYLAGQHSYWQNKLSGYTGLNLTTDYPRPPQISYAGDDVYFSIDSKTSNELRNLAQQLGVSVYSVLLSGFYLFLRGYTNQDDIVIGSPIANRNYAQLENLVGFFVNTLALRSTINPEQTISAYISEIGAAIVEGQLYQDLPFEKLVSELQIEKDSSRHPIFQVMFGVQSFGEILSSNIKYPLFKAHEISHHERIADSYKVAKFDLTVMLNDSEDSIRGSFNYATSLFKRKSIESLINTYLLVLEQLITKQTIAEISYLSISDFNRIIYEWNDTQENYPQSKTIVQLFEEQVQRTPDNIAVVYEDIQLSYAELNTKANQLGAYLCQNYKIGADDLVALCLSRSQYMLIAILGVLKSGAAYVPLDSEYPDERIQYILEDTKASVLLTSSDCINPERTRAWQSGIPPHTDFFVPVQTWSQYPAMIVIDSLDLQAILKSQSTENLNTIINNRNLAYVIYTSGTTGMPKGVMIEHHGVVNLIGVEAKEFNLLQLQDKQVQKNCLQYASYVFDAHVWEIYTVITHGHQLHILSAEKRKDIELLSQYIEQNNIYIATIPPVLLSRDKLLKLKKLVVAGDKTDVSIMEEYRRMQVDVINGYGPTETTVCATLKHFTENTLNTNIGRPIANFTTYVLDCRLQPLPLGAVGELYIGGESLARGYWNRAYTTQERFIANPYQSEYDKVNGTNRLIYKTGDLVRYQENGDLEYMGRNDFQVKIRGFRVELGEIESVLTAYTLSSTDDASVLLHPIQQSVVRAVQHRDANGIPGGNKYLLAYYVAAEPLNEADVFLYLKDRLPDYMLPNRLVYLSQIPMTVNGKLDVKALPEPDLNINGNYVAANGPLELKLCSIFAQILGLDNLAISVADDFFRLGGDSILAIQLVSRIREQINISISIKDIFVYKSVRQLSRYIEQSGTESVRKEILSEHGNLSGICEMLPIQKWFFSNIAQGLFSLPSHWNQSFLIQVDELQSEILECVILKLVQFHDVMRMGFRINQNGEYEQFYHSKINLPKIKYLDRSQLTELEYQDVLTDWQSCFNLFDGTPLFSVGYIYGFNDGSSRIYFSLHHLIISALGWRVIADDVKTLYAKLSQNASIREKLTLIDSETLLGSKGSSYRQWVSAIHSYPKNPEKQYWEQLIQSSKRYNTDLLALAEDETAEIRINISKENSEILLTKGNNPFNTQINQLLLSAFALALVKVSGNATNYITLEGHGQENFADNIDISRTIGWFTSMYPVELIADKTNLGATILAVKAHLTAIPNKGVGFGAINGYHLGELPLIVFNYLGQFELGLSNKAWSIVAEPSGESIHPANHSPNLIDVNGFARDGELHFGLKARISRDKLELLGDEFEFHLNNLANFLSCVRERFYLVNDFVADFSEVYTIHNENGANNIFFLPPGEGGYESYLSSLVPKLGKSRLILFNNYYIHLCSKIDMRNESNNIDFAFLAKFYIQYLKQIQPYGPYNLFGWSFGGVLAFEIARQLEALGDKVSLLGMVDSLFDYQYVINQFAIKANENDINYKYTKNNFYYNQSNANIVLFKALKVTDSVELENVTITEGQAFSNEIFSIYVNSEYNFIEDYLDVRHLKVIPFESSHYKWVSNSDVVDIIAGNIQS